jgi:hypothetical protein
MQASHIATIGKYDKYRAQAREIAEANLPTHLKGVLNISGISHKELAAFKCWQTMPERKVDWNWLFSARYCTVYPKAFDMSVWLGNTLCSMLYALCSMLFVFRSTYL